MTIELLQKTLRALTLEGLKAIERSEFGVQGLRNAIAFFDSEKDRLVTGCAPYQEAVDYLVNLPAITEQYGVGETPRLVLQFVFNACSFYAISGDKDEAFSETYSRFMTEAGRPEWTYCAVANVQNLACVDHPLELVEGISLRPRSFDDLSRLLHWGQVEFDHLRKDWLAGHHGTNVLMVETRAKKSPDNFLMEDDGNQYARASRILMAMRLAKSGDIRIGRMFAARPAVFNVGIGGMLSYGSSHWHPGPTYNVTPADVPLISGIYGDLLALESQPPKANRNLRLALRSFASIYDRLMHQAEDRVVDAVTALEALWRLDGELSFRLAFRTASLLADTDDERVLLFSRLTGYYNIRSKVVHGGGLSAKQETDLQADEPLRDVVRRCLRGFLHLAINPGEWTLARVNKEADTTLLHDGTRKSLRAAMRL